MSIDETNHRKRNSKLMTEEQITELETRTGIPLRPTQGTGFQIPMVRPKKHFDGMIKKIEKDHTIVRHGEDSYMAYKK